jgi:hypothetical protein
MTMRLGVTGSSHGTTLEQDRAIWRLMSHVAATELHHGDCVGADEVFHNAAIGTRIPLSPHEVIIIHPPADPRKRAFC